MHSFHIALHRHTFLSSRMFGHCKFDAMKYLKAFILCFGFFGKGGGRGGVGV